MFPWTVPGRIRLSPGEYPQQVYVVRAHNCSPLSLRVSLPHSFGPHEEKACALLFGLESLLHRKSLGGYNNLVGVPGGGGVNVRPPKESLAGTGHCVCLWTNFGKSWQTPPFENGVSVPCALPLFFLRQPGLIPT